MLKMELEDLRTFVEVADAGGVSAAAVRLGVSKSIVSRRLIRLESELSVQLVARSTRGASLTEAGIAFRDHAARASAEIQLAEETIFQGNALRGRLKVAVPLSSGAVHFAPVLNRIALHHPHLQIDASYSDRLVDLINEGFDCAIRVGSLKDSSLITRRVGRISSKLVASPSYIQQFGSPQIPHDLSLHRALVGNEAWRFADGENIVTVRPHACFRADNSEALASAAVAGLGIAYLPDCVTHQFIESGALVQVMHNFAVPEADVHVVRPSNPHPSRKVRVLSEYLAESFLKDKRKQY
ncbi:transcriptional regulator protein [Bradyrhizobium lupini HPC(L)]|uniref:Transcriptional regulator protein n=2 Tax=Rhizobium lupini TaxID=136996 RepID=A0ABN0HJM0_RHILU|nr:transcriptional regulator protein [Bradyrhizobium lupini HPC(L)]